MVQQCPFNIRHQTPNFIHWFDSQITLKQAIGSPVLFTSTHYNENTNLYMSYEKFVFSELHLLLGLLILAEKQQHVTNNYLQTHEPTNHFRDSGRD